MAAAVMDARCGQVYAALFALEGGGVRRLTPDDAITILRLSEMLEKMGEEVLLVGDGAELCYNMLNGENLPCALAPENMRFQNACGVAMAAAAVPEEAWGDVEPVYLRLSQAERERLEKLKSQN